MTSWHLDPRLLFLRAIFFCTRHIDAAAWWWLKSIKGIR